MTEFNHIVVIITTGSSEEAQKIAGALLENRKAACVNIVPGVSSIFWWQGQMDSEEECLLLVKTKAQLLDDIIALVKQNHSYDLPEIIAMPVTGGSQDYLDWINREVK